MHLLALLILNLINWRCEEMLSELCWLAETTSKAKRTARSQLISLSFMRKHVFLSTAKVFRSELARVAHLQQHFGAVDFDNRTIYNRVRRPAMDRERVETQKAWGVRET